MSSRIEAELQKERAKTRCAGGRQVRGKSKRPLYHEGRLSAVGAMMSYRIFPRALPSVGVTSRSWPAPPHIQLSYETNPFPEPRLRRAGHAVVAGTHRILALQRPGNRGRVTKDRVKCRSRNWG